MSLFILRLKNRLIKMLGGRPSKEAYQKHIYASITQGESIDRKRLSKLINEELIDILCSKSGGADWVHKYLMVEHELRRLENLLNLDLGGQKELNRGLHIADLELKNERLKKEITQMREKAERFNDLLYATGLIVNCTDCLPGGPSDSEHLTEDRVLHVENIAKRLRAWWNNQNKKKVGKKVDGS